MAHTRSSARFSLPFVRFLLLACVATWCDDLQEAVADQLVEKGGDVACDAVGIEFPVSEVCGWIVAHAAEELLHYLGHGYDTHTACSAWPSRCAPGPSSNCRWWTDARSRACVTCRGCLLRRANRPVPAPRQLRLRRVQRECRRRRPAASRRHASHTLNFRSFDVQKAATGRCLSLPNKCPSMSNPLLRGAVEENLAAIEHVESGFCADGSCDAGKVGCCLTCF